MKKLLLALAVCCFLFACDKNEKQPEEPAEAPELTLTSESVVNVPADGDEVTITYTLANPAENGDISAKAADGGDWCDGFNCDTDGQVTFTVAANEGDARETVVTVTYTYGEGEHKDITVTVKQVALGDPLFELTSESEVSVGKDGGDVTVTYSITDPREDGAVSVTVPEGVDWISNVNTDTDGQVTFTVAANEGDAREAELTFVYTYGGSETQEFKVKVSQADDSIVFDAKYAYGVYYGDDLSSKAGEMVYQMWFSDVPESDEWAENATYYIISVVAGAPANMNAIAPAAGTYSLLEGDDTQTGTIWSNYDYTYACATGDDSSIKTKYIFISGDITLTKDGNSIIVEGSFVDTDNKIHRLNYTGSILLDDGREPDIPEDALSTLTGDVVDFNADWTNTVADGYFFGSMNEEGVKEYTMSIKDGSYKDYRTMILTVYMPLSNTVDDGIIAGTYPVSADVAENTVRAGYLNEGSTYLQGSWYYDRTYTYPETEAGPLTSGEVTFERNGDGTYNVTVDAQDDAGHVIKATFPNITYSVFDMTSL